MYLPGKLIIFHFQFGSFRHFEVDSQHIYEDMCSETGSSSDTIRANSYNSPRQNSPESFVERLSPYTESVHSKPGKGLRPPQWPPYMPPTPPIPHDYYAPSPETPSCPHSNYSTSHSSAGNLDFEVSRHKRRVRFSDNVNIRIIFRGIGEGDRDLLIDTQLVDVFRFGPVFDFGPIRVVVAALTSWMS